MIFSVLFVMATGLVISGLVRNLWPLLTGSEVSLEFLSELTWLSPIKGLVMVLSAPAYLFSLAVRELFADNRTWMKAGLATAGALGQCFLQGTVFLATFSAI